MFQTDKYRQAILLCLLLILTTIFISAKPAAAAVTITHPGGGTVAAEAPDFAIDEFSDPWDFSQSSDYRLEDAFNISNLHTGGGLISGRSTSGDPRFFVDFPGYLAAWAFGRDGLRHPINTGKYRYFSARVYVSKPTVFQIYWFYNQTWTSYGFATKYLHQGWNTFRLDLGALSSWQGSPIGLRVDPASQSGVDFKIDWLKLHQAAGAANKINISWNDSSPGGTVRFYLDNDADTGNGNLGIITEQPSNSAANNWLWDTSDLPAGSYYVFAEKNGVKSAVAGPWKIQSPPLLEVLDPDKKGGRDYATDVTGNPWDMNSLNDLDASYNINHLYANGVLTGRNTNGDPNIYLRVGAPIDTNRYHRLTFSMAFDPPFGFGQGTMARFIWNPRGHNVNSYQTSDDIVVYPNWTEYTIDLKKIKLDSGSLGWRGKMETFRFDPLEVFNKRTFWLDRIMLRADDEASSKFTIKWRDRRASAPATKVSIYYDNDNKGYNGHLIAQNISQKNGINTYNWNVSGLDSGLYYIYIVADDGLSVSRRYSTGPLRVKTPKVPRWYVKKSKSTGFAAGSAWNAPWGNPGDKPLTGNFDGDAYTDIAIYRPANAGWYVRRSLGNGFSAGTSWSRVWGNPRRDQPLVGDFDGDGQDDIGIHRPGAMPNWFFKLSSGGGFKAAAFKLPWGNPRGDKPLVGDFNGDGRDDIGIYRYGSYPNWFFRLSNSSAGSVAWGSSWSLSWGNPGGDTPIVGDFNGDGRDDIGIYRYGSYPNWFILRAKSGGGFISKKGTWAFNWGNPGGDTPIVGDFNGDSGDDIGIYRLNAYPNWFAKYSHGDSGFAKGTDAAFPWGDPLTDRPLTGDFSGDGLDDLGIFRVP